MAPTPIPSIETVPRIVATVGSKVDNALAPLDNASIPVISPRPLNAPEPIAPVAFPKPVIPPNIPAAIIPGFAIVKLELVKLEICPVVAISCNQLPAESIPAEAIKFLAVPAPTAPVISPNFPPF